MPTQSDTFDLLTEVRGQVMDVKRILLGNGSVGLCEQTRQNARDVAAMATTVNTLAASVKTVSECQQMHRDWHAAPENMTIQQALARPGIRFVALLLIGVLVLISATVGIVDAVGIVKAWLS
jgi:hypothetical protein